jgi:hypothetical protein
MKRRTHADHEIDHVILAGLTSRVFGAPERVIPLIITSPPRQEYK